MRCNRRDALGLIGCTVTGTAVMSGSSTADNTIKVGMGSFTGPADYTIRFLNRDPISDSVSSGESESYAVESDATIDEIKATPTGNSFINYDFNIESDTTPTKDDHRFEVRGDGRRYSVSYDGEIIKDSVPNLEADDTTNMSEGTNPSQINGDGDVDTYAVENGRFTRATFVLNGGKIKYSRL